MAKKTSKGTKKTNKRRAHAPAGVTFYEAVNGDTNGGFSFRKTARHTNLRHFIGPDGQREGFWNDRISGFIVEPGVTCTVYKNIKKAPYNTYKVFEAGSYTNLWRDYPEWDQQISAIEIDRV